MTGFEDLLLGHTLAQRYLIEEVIGRGGMGAVFRARDQRLDREVAVKVVALAAPNPAAQERLRARFNQEARAAAGLDHPNVVVVHDFGTDDARKIDYLVMELLRGEDLDARLDGKGKPALRTALDILLQAARGLSAGHRVGIIHRDVKPGNLFLKAGDRPGDVLVKVLDFGIAEMGGRDERTVTRLTQFGRSPFSPAYASPEQLRGEHRLLPATDVFSLGAVGFHLLAGRRAFTHSDPGAVVAQVNEGLAHLAGRVPAPVREVLDRALAARPEERYRHAGAFAEALEAAIVEPDVLRTAPPVAASTTPPERRRERRREPTPDPTPPPRWTTPPSPAAGGIAGPRQPLFPGAQNGLGPVSAQLGEDLARSHRARALAASPPPRSRTVEPAPKVGWFRRAASAVWNFCITTATAAALAYCWVGIAQSTAAGDRTGVYFGVAFTALLAPLAVHRILGYGGNWLLAIVLSFGVTLGVHRFLTLDWTAPALLAGVCALQLLSSALAERLTSRLAVRSA